MPWTTFLHFYIQYTYGSNKNQKRGSGQLSIFSKWHLKYGHFCIFTSNFMDCLKLQQAITSSVFISREIYWYFTNLLFHEVFADKKWENFEKVDFLMIFWMIFWYFSLVICGPNHYFPPKNVMSPTEELKFILNKEK